MTELLHNEMLLAERSRREAFLNLNGALQGGRGPRRLLPVRSATPGSGSSRAARRRRLGGCDKRLCRSHVLGNYKGTIELNLNHTFI